MPWISLCELSQLVERRGKYVQIERFRLALFLHRGQVYAMDDNCPHAGGSLASGRIDNGCAVCPRHGWSFRLTDGQLQGMAGVTISTYQTRLLERPEAATLVQADLPEIGIPTDCDAAL